MSLNLMDALHELAEIWVQDHAIVSGKKVVTLATLGARVHKDAKLFDRLEQGAISVPRYEALIDYLAEGVSWPDGSVPADARAVLRRLGIVQPGERLIVERDTVERHTIAEA